METHHLYWWNVENLFDTFNNPDRPAWLQRKLNNELKGWDAQVLNKKIANLTSIIRQFNSDTGPDIMGICEVENKHVVQLLTNALKNATGRNYTVLHHNSDDFTPSRS